jgi:hypothetical protein
MDSIYAYLMVAAGILVRLGIPVALTILLVEILRRLDDHWQQEGEASTPVLAVNTRCWEIHNCSSENRASCQAYTHPETPCWQVFRNREGLLREECLGCQVFEKAPVPATS